MHYNYLPSEKTYKEFYSLYHETFLANQQRFCSEPYFIFVYLVVFSKPLRILLIVRERRGIRESRS